MPAHAHLRSILGAVRTVAFGVIVTAMAIASGAILLSCDAQGPTVAEYLEKSGMKDKPVIRIAVLDDVPLLGLEQSKVFTGFDVEIGRYIAKSLGFETDNDRDIVWVRTKLEDRERIIQEDRADIVLATYSITEERKKRVRFAGPYLITSQELLIHKSLEGKVRNLTDLAKSGIEVCVPGATTSEATMGGYKIPIVPNATSQLCLDGIKSGEYQIFSTDEVVLAGFNSTVKNEFLFVDLPIEFTEQYGVGMSKDAVYLQALVEHYLLKSFNHKGGDSPWQVAWNKTLKSAVWPSDNGRQQPRPEISVSLRDIDDKNQQLSATGGVAGRPSHRQSAILARRAPRRRGATR